MYISMNVMSLLLSINNKLYLPDDSYRCMPSLMSLLKWFIHNSFVSSLARQN